jgi:hypothetical protein
MTDNPTVIAEQVIFMDASGRVTVDRDRAVRGEALRTYSDGTTESTLFTIDPSATP